MGKQISDTIKQDGFSNISFYNIEKKSSIEPYETEINDIIKTYIYKYIWESGSSFSIDESEKTNKTNVEETKKVERYENVPVNPDDIDHFVNLVDISCLDSGYSSEAEEFIMFLCDKRGFPYVKNLINSVYVKHVKNEILMCTAIKILSHIDYTDLGDFAVTFSMAMIADGTPLIWEYVINACDTWNSMDFIDCLERVNTDSFLLKRMIEKVVYRIKKSNGRL